MIIADSGFFIALIDSKDNFHKRCIDILQHLSEPLITTQPIITEVSYIILKRYGWPTLIRFLSNMDNGLSEIFDLRKDHTRRIIQFIRKYRDLPADYVDASLLVLAEEIGHGRILTTDRRDFGAYRWKERKPFVNLLSY